MEASYVLLVNLIISLIGCIMTLVLAPRFRLIFLSAHLFSKDKHKKLFIKIADGFGIFTSIIYMMCLVFFIPFAFMQQKTGIAFLFKNLIYDKHVPGFSVEMLNEFFTQDHLEVIYLTSGLTTICLISLIGFIGDLLEMDQHAKFYFPLVALLPIMLVYCSMEGKTTVALPVFFGWFLPITVIHLGILYYVGLTLAGLFYINSIRLLSGINGVEAGQAIVISVSIILFNFVELRGPEFNVHKLSLYFLIPFVGTSFGLLYYNWYPAKVFVGDSFCFFTGAVFAIIGIYGHIAETMLVFFLPQLFNFLYSLPQFLHILPFPYDRSPKLNSRTGMLERSKVRVDHKVLKSGRGFKILSKLQWCQLISLVKNPGGTWDFDNLTLTNVVLKIMGPMKEVDLTVTILIIQAFASVLGFVLLLTYRFLFYVSGYPHSDSE